MTQPAPNHLELPTSDTSVQDAARLYALAGFTVIPLYGIRSGACTCGDPNCHERSHGKHPIGKDWQKRASSDPDRVRALFRGHDGNIGLMLTSSFLCVDVDGDAGWNTLSELPALPDTLTARTGSGGGHFVFRLAQHQDAGKISNTRYFSRASGIDIKTREGQIVVAPSLHRLGERYTWTNPIAPAVLPEELYQLLLTPPAEVRALQAKPKNPNLYERASKYLDAIPSAISGSRGHDQTFAAARAVAGWIVNKGLPEQDGWSLLVAYNRRCEPPWTAKELKHKFDQALQANELPNPEDRDLAPRPVPQAMLANRYVPAPTEDTTWKQLLLGEEKRKGWTLYKHQANVVAILKHHPAWRGRLRYDEHAQVVTVCDAPWHEVDGYEPTPSELHSEVPWTDQDDARLINWLMREREFTLDVGIETVSRAVEVVARAAPYHPVRDYFDSLVWDNQPRLATFAREYLGTPHTEYAASVMRWWLTSAVARTYQPGAKADHVLILEGKQGKAKSSAMRVLAGSWFSDEPIVVGSKDALTTMHGKLIVELPELDAFRKSDAAALKAFFSKSIDTYRPPYGRRNVTVPRCCVFVGTVNPEGAYLSDRTGNRRYWPVECTTIDLEALKRDRDQIWAEAVRWYRSGGKWWPDTDAERALCAGEQEQREEYDDWENSITDHINKLSVVNGGFFTTGDILSAIGVDRAHHDKSVQMRVAKFLGRIGCRHTVSGPPNDRKRGWRRC